MNISSLLLLLCRPSSLYNFVLSLFTCENVAVSLDASMDVPGAFEDTGSPTSPSLPFYRTEDPEVVDRDKTLRLQGDGVVQAEWSRYAFYL